MQHAEYAERFWARVTKGEGCWERAGCHTPDGYTRLRFEGLETYGHRVAYELVVGPIPEGFVIDHLCRNPGCVRPDHLEAVTQQENIQRGLRGRMVTHCPGGHEYTPESTRWHRSGKNGQYWTRHCRLCSNLTKAQRDRLRSDVRAQT